jgi:hypothetical protein
MNFITNPYSAVARKGLANAAATAGSVYGANIDQDKLGQLYEAADMARRGITSAGSSLIPQVFGGQRAAGGRIERKAGGRIGHNPISAEINRIRIMLRNQTEQMLSVPDDAIATALQMAKNR